MVSPCVLACDQLAVGSAVCVEGAVVAGRRLSDRGALSDRCRGELVAHSVRPLGPSPSESLCPTTTPVDPASVMRDGRLTHSSQFGLLRSPSGLWWRHRLPEFAAMLRLRATVKSAVHTVLANLGYLEVSQRSYYHYSV